jgi:hypothetical protein
VLELERARLRAAGLEERVRALETKRSARRKRTAAR